MWPTLRYTPIYNMSLHAILVRIFALPSLLYSQCEKKKERRKRDFPGSNSGILDLESL